MAPELRKAQLLDCAVIQFSKLGIGGTFHSDVAELAQVSVPTVYSYFPSADSLKISVVNVVRDRLINIIENAALPADSAKQKLEKVLYAFAQLADDEPKLIKLWLDWSTIIAPPTWAAYESFQDEVLKRFTFFITEGINQGTLRRDLNATVGAHVVMGSGHMIAQMKFRRRDDSLIRKFVENIVYHALFVTD